MGTTLRRGQRTADTLDLTASGFFRFRLLIAQRCNRELGEHYEKLIPPPKDWDAYNRELNRIIDANELDDDILDFLFAPDCGGEADRNTCRKLLELLDGVENLSNFGYEKKPVSLEDIVDLLRKCQKNKSKLFWH